MQDSLPNTSSTPSPKDTSGQLLIFFAMTTLLLVSLLAFVVNVGMFVKAKINLQNAVDAAAWSGAAVQARQLTNIAYLNWEMRNNFKEWMFKYYILGELSLPKTRPPTLGSTSVMDFRLDKIFTDATGGDLFNVPSTCIHFASTSNICMTYSVPGLPRFEAVGFPGLDETHNNFINAIVKTKSEDCSKRSRLNFLTALNWAYGTGELSQQLTDTPQIANARPGAWSKGFELAIRMRNLEFIVNTPPHPNPICLQGSNCDKVSTIEQEANATSIPLEERTVKAFWSGYRTLGRDNQEDELKANFKLTELPPKPLITTEKSLSALLIPAANNTKHYLDLQLYLLNYATFFTTFVSKTAASNSGKFNLEGQCDVTKMAMPVPGFPFGFVKNPGMVTYYAVKGESKYIGLFYPFSSSQGIDLVAYGAAKPFGGRIGPKLFETSDQTISARAYQGKSAPYISGINPSTLGTVFKTGFPMPLAASFWITQASDVIGGQPASNAAGSIKFGIPNMIYDMEGNTDNQVGSGSSGNIQIINQTSGPVSSQPLGLYDAAQFRAMNNNLKNGQVLATGGVVTTDDIEEGVLKARGPTRYEALNYLIPTHNNQAEGIDSINYVNTIPQSRPLPPGVIQYDIFAPLAGPQVLYPDINAVVKALEDFIKLNGSAVDVYMTALFDIAQSIINDGKTFAGGNYGDAANKIHDGANPFNPSCKSFAGSFNAFYKPDVKCGPNDPPQVSLKESILTTWNNSASVGGSVFLNKHRTMYYKSPGLANKDIMTGFIPGPRSGATPDGNIEHPFIEGRTVLSRRNFYSTKFVGINALFAGGANSLIGNSNFTPLSEGNSSTNNLGNVTFLNPLDEGKVKGDFSNITH